MCFIFIQTLASDRWVFEDLTEDSRCFVIQVQTAFNRFYAFEETAQGVVDEMKIMLEEAEEDHRLLTKQQRAKGQEYYEKADRTLHVCFGATPFCLCCTYFI